MKFEIRQLHVMFAGRGMRRRHQPPRSFGTRASHRILATVVAVMAAVSYAVPQARGDSKSFQEYEVKAGFLFHFVQFVDWPDSAFAGKEAPISIGVLGTDPFGPILDRIVQGETVHNRKIIVKRSNKIEELKACQVLFISKSEKDQIPQILGALGDSPVLTISEVDGFAGQGGVFNFYAAENKVRFEVNPDSAKRRGLAISSKLIGLGTVVRQ